MRACRPDARHLCAVLLAVAGCSSDGGGESNADAGADARLANDAATSDAQTVSDGSMPLDGSPDARACAPARIATSLPSLIDAIASAMSAGAPPASNATVVPTSIARDAFAAATVAALSGDFSAACTLPAPYRLVSIADGADDLLVVAEVDAVGTPAPALFWGTYVARAGAGFARVIVEAPHPLFDTHTEREAADLFVHVRASALLVAGSHRCANTTASPCSGTTTACGASAAFRVSDAAHSRALPFDAVHDALSRASTAPFLQLHGNAATCPSALVSDSSGAWSTTGLAATFATALEANGVVVGRCGNGYPTAACNLCGTDNVQARFTASSADACMTNGTSYGRFIHVEQQPALRLLASDGGAAGYAPLLAAAAATFP